MIQLCADAGLPEPEFRGEGERFVTVVWRDWLTNPVMDELGLNDRQKAAMTVLRRDRKITNSEYQSVTGTSRATAKRDIEDLVAKGVLVLCGRGRGAHYETPRKRLTNGSNGSESGRSKNGS
jgi:ATP-dependent DNA helicase RecG